MDSKTFLREMYDVAEYISTCIPSTLDVDFEVHHNNLSITVFTGKYALDVVNFMDSLHVHVYCDGEIVGNYEFNTNRTEESSCCKYFLSVTPPVDYIELTFLEQMEVLTERIQFSCFEEQFFQLSTVYDINSFDYQWVKEIASSDHAFLKNYSTVVIDKSECVRYNETINATGSIEGLKLELEKKLNEQTRRTVKNI